MYVISSIYLVLLAFVNLGLLSLQDAFDDGDEEVRFDRSSLHNKINAQLETEEAPCFFDRANKKSPCHYSPCQNEEDLKCVKYVLEYCGAYEDRGCVVNKPQLLNKKGHEEMIKISTTRPLFIS